MTEDSTAITVTEATFQAEVIERSKKVPVLVDFWAPWCMPCRTLSPMLDRVVADSGGSLVLAKVNTDENPGLAAQYDVRGIPAVKMFRGGRVVDEFVGVRPEREVRDFVRAFAPSQIDRWLIEADSLVYGERWEDAEQAYRRILEVQPHQPQAALALGRMLIAIGRGVEAEAALREVPSASPEAATAEALLPLADLMQQAASDASEGLDGLYAEAGRLLMQRRVPVAIDTLLELLRRDRHYREGQGKRAALALITYLGDDPAAGDYRRRLANVLF